MFRALTEALPRDPDLPERAFRLECLARVLDGTLYDHLAYDFRQEEGPGGEYIPVWQRRPSARYALCRIVVDDSVSLLFSEGHFPHVECADPATRAALAAIMRETRLNSVMIEAATRGSVGSVALLLRVLNRRLFVEALDTRYLTPVWARDAPDRLASVTERYKVQGAALAAEGYAIAPDDRGRDFWFQRVWDAQAETWFLPWPVSRDPAPEAAGEVPQIDAGRTVQHALGFVPLVWIRNLPSLGVAADIDGDATFRAAIEPQIEIEYQMSQAGRGLRYSSDPLLLIKEPALTDSGELVRSSSRALVTAENGDAKLVEISGAASAAVIDYVRALREMALESVHGNRSSADKLSAAQSGRAMELMNQSLIWLVDRLRASYGEGGLLPLMQMIVAVSRRMPLTVVSARTGEAEALPPLQPQSPLSLRWPPWFHSTSTDRQQNALALKTLTTAGIMSRATATAIIAQDYDIPDPAAEAAVTPDPAAEAAVTPDPAAEAAVTPDPAAEAAVTPDPAAEAAVITIPTPTSNPEENA